MAYAQDETDDVPVLDESVSRSLAMLIQSSLHTCAIQKSVSIIVVSMNEGKLKVITVSMVPPASTHSSMATI